MIRTAARPLIIPGGQRCGSTWLLRFLSAHPAVAFSPPVRPEPKVFLKADADRSAWWARCGSTVQAHHSWVVEKSTSYLERPQVIDRIDRHLPDAHVLVILRDPVERAISNWRFSVSNGLEDRGADVALATESPGDTHSSPVEQPNADARNYLRRGRYVELLAPWRERFDGRITIVVLEDLAADETARLSLCSQLGIQTHRTAPPPANTSVATETIDPRVRARLRSYYAPLQPELEVILGRALWSDDVDRHG